MLFNLFLHYAHAKPTVNFLNIRTPKQFVVITLKFELCGTNIRVMSPNDADRMANSVDPDQTAPLGAEEQTDLVTFF